MSAAEKITNASSCISGSLSFLGSYQICHNVCLGILLLLSAIGITTLGMPLLFLQKIALPAWSIAVVLLFISFAFYFQKRCISKNILIFNTGIIIAGVPFRFLQDYIAIFWIVGGSFISVSILLFFSSKILKRKEAEKDLNSTRLKVKHG